MLLNGWMVGWLKGIKGIKGLKGLKGLNGWMVGGGKSEIVNR
jgi:hypothetical protein